MIANCDINAYVDKGLFDSVIDDDVVVFFQSILLLFSLISYRCHPALQTISMTLFWKISLSNPAISPQTNTPILPECLLFILLFETFMHAFIFYYQHGFHMKSKVSYYLAC